MGTLLLLEGIFAIILKTFNVGLHSLGIYLLHCLCKTDKVNVQMLYILNLSVSELIINLVSVIRYIVRVIGFNSPLYKTVLLYSYIFDYTVLKSCLYMWMLYITLDRVAGVVMNITYPVWWDRSKAKHLVTFTWMSAFVIFLITLIVHIITRDEFHFFKIANYFIIVFDVSFVVAAVVAYIIIFDRFQKSLKHSILHRNSKRCEKNLWKVFRSSRFYVSLFLILTYILFTIIPDLLWTFGAVGDDHTASGFLICILYGISYTSDGMIYIFMQKKVKNMLYLKIKCLRCFKKDSRKSKTGSKYQREMQVIALCRLKQ